jgi:hypothetical protein
MYSTKQNKSMDVGPLFIKYHLGILIPLSRMTVTYKYHIFYCCKVNVCAMCNVTMCQCNVSAMSKFLGGGGRLLLRHTVLCMHGTMVR